MKGMTVLLVLLVAMVVAGFHVDPGGCRLCFEEWTHPEYGRCEECFQVWKRAKWSIGLGTECPYCGGAVDWQSLGEADYERYEQFFGGSHVVTAIR
jgi:hypothetical protein